MLNTNHPDEERLSALASGEADASVAEHVASCDTCADVVSELRAIGAWLAELPDVAPSRPLRLLPAAEPASDRLSGWVRRLFAPALTAGVLLVAVGSIGSVAPAFSAATGVPQGPAVDTMNESRPSERVTVVPDGAFGGEGINKGPTSADNGEDPPAEVSREVQEPDRPLWPVLIFGGIALIIGAVLLRWIVVPRAG